MTDVIHGTAPIADRVPALQGLLVAESERDISVRVGEGTWTFHRDDVLRMLDAPTTSSNTLARAVLVDIRPGATADFTRRLRIDLVDRPMTFAAPPSRAVGDDLLEQLTESWADDLRLDTSPGNPNARCCYTKSFATSGDGTGYDSLD